jgi:ABC-2 type transport system permease protein
MKMIYWTAFRTLLIKEILRFARIWVQTILPPAITMALYFIIFGKLIGSQIGDIEGFRYIDFIVPGLILMSVISNSYANTVSSFYFSRWNKHIDELLIAPIPNWLILAGYVAGGVARGVIVGIVVTIVASFFSDLSIHSYGITFLVFVLTSVLFSLAGFINGVFANSFDDISIIPTFVLTPLTYLGGVFYSMSLLPEFWQSVSMANPVLYMVNAFRYGLLGVSDIDLSSGIAIILGFTLVLSLYAHSLMKRGVGIKN